MHEWLAFRGFMQRFVCSIDDGAGTSGGGAVAETPAVEVPTETAETPVVDAPAAEAGDAPTEGAEKPQEPTEDTHSVEFGEDGVSPAAKKLIDSLKKTDPGTAKHIKNIVYADAALRKEFPGGLKEAQGLKRTVLELAGDEGLDGLKENVAAWKSIDERFAKGDPSVLEDFSKFNKESFDAIVPPAILKLAESNPASYGETMPSAIDKLSEVAPEVYSQYMSGVLTATLDNYKIADTITGLVRSLSTIKDGDGNVVAGDEITTLQGMFKTLENFRELSKKAPVKKTEAKADPAKSEYEAKLKELNDRETKATVNQISEAINSHATTKYDELVGTELKASGVNLPKAGEAYKGMIRDIDVRIGKEIAADQKFQDKYNALVAAGKSQDAIQLANSRFDQVAFKTVRSVVTLWSKDIKGTPPKVEAEAKPEKTSGVVELKQAPSRDKVDWERTSRQDFIFGRNVYLRGDNRVYKF